MEPRTLYMLNKYFTTVGVYPNFYWASFKQGRSKSGPNWMLFQSHFVPNLLTSFI